MLKANCTVFFFFYCNSRNHLFSEILNSNDSKCRNNFFNVDVESRLMVLLCCFYSFLERSTLDSNQRGIRRRGPKSDKTGRSTTRRRKEGYGTVGFTFHFNLKHSIQVLWNARKLFHPTDTAQLTIKVRNVIKTSCRTAVLDSIFQLILFSLGFWGA